MATSPMTLRISEETKARLSVIAEQKDRSPHYLVKQALESYLDDAEREAEELSIVKERWKRYEATGSYVPGEKVRAWIASLPRERDDVA